jgi:hypothetical protein
MPSKASTGKLTPSRKKRRKRQAQAVLPARASEAPDIDSVHREPESSAESGAKDSRSPKNTRSDLSCNVCRRHFSARKHLNRHLANPRLHQKNHKCAECGEAFYQFEELKSHLSDTGHTRSVPQSRRSQGTFTTKEKAKLDQFKRRFCNDNSLSEFEFNTLMTLLGRRGGSEWPNPDVTRAEFRDMFYNVLPDRSIKSMNRYRERHFQNVEQDTEWTEEQISELRDLVNERGHKWVDIGRRLGRTQDSVHQKWKNRIRQGDAQRFQRWEESERKALIVAVQECKKAAGVAQDFSSDDKVNWTAVSDRLDRTRNAQQCSTFWKRVYRPREEAKARGEEVKPFGRARSKPEPTMSRRHSRRRVTRGGEEIEVVTPRRKVKSAMYVTECDDEETSGQDTRLKEGKRHPRSEQKYSASQESNASEQDAGSTEDTRTTERQPFDESDDAEEEDGDSVEDEPPTRKTQRKGEIDPMTSSPAAVRNPPELQPASSQKMSGSFQAVNRPQHEAAASLRWSGTRNATPKNPSVAISSPRSQRGPSLLPLSKRTPRQVTSLTQVFNDTQGPTSARTPGHITPGERSIEQRPSPDIEMRLQPLQQGSPAMKDDSDNEDAIEPSETAGPSTSEFAVYESEAESSDERQSDHKFSSAVLHPAMDGVAEGETETDSDFEAQNRNDEQPPQMFSSAAIPMEATEPSGVESSSEEEYEETEDGTEEKSQAEEGSEAEEKSKVEESEASEASEESKAAENDDPPQMFTSAFPEQEGDSPKPDQNRFSSSSSSSSKASSTTSSDARTILPNEPNDTESGGETSSSDSDSDSDGDESMVEAAQGDFFANLEASAEKVLLQRANIEGRKLGVHGNVRGQGRSATTKGSSSNVASMKRKLVYAVSSGSS